MNWESHLLSGWAGVAAFALPAIVLMGLNFLNDAPMEWGRGMLQAYLALCLAMIAGLAAQDIGAAGLLAALAAGFAVFVTGGTTGMVITTLGMGAMAAILVVTGSTALHPALAPVLAATGALAVLRQFWGGS